MKKKYIIGIFVFVVCLIGIFIFQNRNKQHTITDAVRFAEEYDITKENVFVYRNAEEIIKILENGTGIVYLGFPECQWCKAYVPILNDVAKENNITKIYYFNILEDRKNNTKDYQKIMSFLKDNLDYDDEGNHRIFVPDVTFILDGEIIGHDNETSVISDDITPKEYWTTEKVKDLKKRLTEYMNKLNEDGMCTTGCNE